MDLQPVPGSVSVVQTHISFLFFIGDRVYKLKRPVRFPFLDSTTRERREDACRREVELNRRLAPDVYLGVATVLDPQGSPCDHLVVMRRMPDDRRLSTMIERGLDVEPHVRGIARSIAVFHEGAATSQVIANASTRDAVGEDWEQNFRELEPYAGHVFPRDGLARAHELVRQYLAGRAPLFERRITRGRVRDCHGDLLADDIFCLDDRPRILDCIEFNDVFRYTDVVADVAFLAMDLERLRRADLAAKLLTWYREFSGDAFPDSLADHYVAYRAVVRAKIACIRANEGDAAAGQEARKLLALAGARLEQARPTVLVVGGLPGTGKSTLADGVADARGWIVIRSDEVRKDLAGVGHVPAVEDAFRRGIYSPKMTERTYGEMFARARRSLAMGESVVLDASWSDRRHRAAAASVASDLHADLIEFRCDTPQTIADARMSARHLGRLDASDATPEIARRMRGGFDPWPRARRIDTTPQPTEVIRLALDILAAERHTDTTASAAG